MHRMKLLIIGMAMLLPGQAVAEVASKMATLYKNPLCGCCEDHAAYLRHNGYDVKVIASHDLPQLRAKHGVSEALTGCHMTLIEGYVIEGHMPISMINKLLAERPNIRGIALLGMPFGAPGMAGPKTGPFTIYEIAAKATDGEPRIFAVE